MKQATITFQVICENFHRCSIPACSALKTNNRKSTPCTGPIALTQSGLPAKCLAGTAMNTNTNKEMPSSKARSRKRPMVVVKYLNIH